MDTIYRKVEIKSEQDLPKEDGDYIVHSKSFGWIGLANWKAFENANYPEYNQYLWLLNYDWYLQPIEPQEDKIEQPEISVTDEEIEKYARNEFDKYYRVMGTFGPYFRGVKDCAKLMRDKLKANG